MILSSISRRERRTIGGGGALMLALLAVRAVPLWSSATAESRAAAREAVREASLAEASVRARGAVRDSLASRSARLIRLAPAFLSGDTPAAAAASLAGIVSGAAALSRVQLGALQPRGDSASGGSFTRIAVRAEATGDVKGIMALIAALERGPTLLAVRQLSITQSEPAAPDTQMEALRAELLVEGLALNRKTTRGAR